MATRCAPSGVTGGADRSSVEVPLYAAEPSVKADSRRSAPAIPALANSAPAAAAAASKAAELGDLWSGEVWWEPPPQPATAVRTVRHGGGTAPGPFCNFRKFGESKRALAGESAYVTSAGPYLGQVERRREIDATARRMSLHERAFNTKGDGLNHGRSRSSGREEKAALNNASFGAAGMQQPADISPSATYWNNYYNVPMHKFRVAKSKQNVYM